MEPTFFVWGGVGHGVTSPYTSRHWISNQQQLSPRRRLGIRSRITEMGKISRGLSMLTWVRQASESSDNGDGQPRLKTSLVGKSVKEAARKSKRQQACKARCCGHGHRGRRAVRFLDMGPYARVLPCKPPPFIGHKMDDRPGIPQ